MERLPDRRIAWRALNGPAHAGVVMFERLDERSTRVRVRMELEPRGLTERIGAVCGSVGHRMNRDLARFKEFIEIRGLKTGGRTGGQGRSVRPGPNERPVTGDTSHH